MEGKFDSFEQLFPWVHDRDANAVRPRHRASPHRVFRVSVRPQWTGGTGRWRVQDPPWAADRCRCGVVDRHSFRRARRPARQHLRHRRDHHDRRRTRRAAPRRFATGSLAAAGPSITASSAGSRSQFRNRATAWAAALERLDEAAKPPPRAAPGDPPVGFGGAQAAGSQTTCCRAQADQAGRRQSRNNSSSDGIMCDPNAQELVNRYCAEVHPLTT